MNVSASAAILLLVTGNLSVTRNLQASDGLEFSSSASMSVSGQNLQGQGRIAFGSSANVTVSRQALQGRGGIVFGSSANVTTSNQWMVGAGSLSFASFPNLLVTRNLQAAVTLEIRASAPLRIEQSLAGEAALRFLHRAELEAGRNGLGVCDVIRHILLLWGVEHPCSAPPFVRSAALDYLNASMQLVWNQAKDRNYWTRSTQTVTLPADTSSLALADSIQNVIGPVRRADTKRPLVLVSARAEIDQFEDLYLDGEGSGTPVGYHIERMSQPGKEPVACVFHVAPAPTAETSFLMDVVLEAPRFSWSDVNACVRVPMPHRYVESLLLPVARYHAMSCHLFIFPERAKQITEDYAQASAMLETADPIPDPA
jgi:hypothetical protein